MLDEGCGAPDGGKAENSGQGVLILRRLDGEGSLIFGGDKAKDRAVLGKGSRQTGL